MVWLLILFVVAVALVPLTHFVPSKRQRAIAGMREKAAMAGLFVEFRDAPGGSDRPFPSEVHPGAIIYYGKRLPASRARAPDVSSWRRDTEGWIGVGGYAPIPDSFARFPPAVVAASIDPVSCGVYWDESSGEESVEAIRLALEHWVDSFCATKN